MASSPQQPDAASRINKSTIDSAISALLKYKAAQSAKEKPQLFPSDDYIYLNLTLKYIPSKSRTNPFKISLPHPLLDHSSQICLIIDDRPKSPTPASDEMKKLVKSQDIPISKVLKISKLNANYKPFEAKRKLCDSYDLFLVDKRVVHLLPKLIGKEFFKKKKLPLGVDLSKKNLKLQVERALGSALLFMRTGTCCVMKVGKVSMDKEEIVDNVFSAVLGAAERVPKQWSGVRSLHLKFYDSVALPIYQAMPDVKLKIEGAKKKGVRLAKLSDSEGEVKDGKSGRKSKGRIHEVRYMDVGDVMVSDDDFVDGDEEITGEDNDGLMGQKNWEANLIEEGESEGNEDEENTSEDEDEDEDEENTSEDEDEALCRSRKKKRSKDETMKEGVLSKLDEKKRVKRSAKGEKVEGVKPKDDGSAGGENGRKKGKKRIELNMSSTKRISKVKDLKEKKKLRAK